jgi:hypothetical protein
MKSLSLHLSETPTSTRDTNFQTKNQEIWNLRDGEFDKFLGMPVGFQITRNTKGRARLMETANTILQCNLARWQRLDAFKTFFFPSLNFLMRTARTQKGYWTTLDYYEYIRASSKKTLILHCFSNPAYHSTVSE